MPKFIKGRAVYIRDGWVRTTITDYRRIPGYGYAYNVCGSENLYSEQALRLVPVSSKYTFHDLMGKLRNDTV